VVTEIRIYFEGNKSLRSGFHTFFSELVDAARAQRCKFELISAGAKEEAVQDFKDALSTHSGAWNILLLDSDKPNAGDLSFDLCRRNRIDQRHADSVFWMVQIMESWFLADKDAVARYYGKEFRSQTLPQNPRVEEVSKGDIYTGLEAATGKRQEANTTRRSTVPGCWPLLNRDALARPRRTAGGCSTPYERA
jgi:hypothetical protein